MATSASELSISDLADVLAALTEVTEPYQLGIQLKVDLAELDTIERNHPGNIGRQKTEVIKYWLRNSPDASWTTLANVVEGMGGHARLAERLRSEENKSVGEIKTKLVRNEMTEAIPLDRSTLRNILLLGKSGRQKTEVIKYWLRNSPDASWTTLAIAVERMGGHDNLARTLSSEKLSLMPPARYEIGFERANTMYFIRGSRTTYVNRSTPRNILLLGKTGHGKSTLGNRLLNSDGCFSINDQKCPQTTMDSAILQSASQLKDYRVTVYDHNGLFEGASSIDMLASDVSSILHLVIFVLKQGCRCDESVVKRIIEKWQISEISALVLTHCERMSKEERKKVIKQFVSDHPSVAELMGKGILTVGFPDSSYVKNETELSERVENDKAKLRQLVYSSDVPVEIPQTQNGIISRWLSLCSIL